MNIKGIPQRLLVFFLNNKINIIKKIKTKKKFK